MKIKQRFLTYVNTAAAALALACGPSGSNASRSSAPTFRVALLTPGPISDHSWNAGAYQGLLRIRDSLNAQISNVQTDTPAEFEENFRQYGAQGFSLVIGHGFEFQDAAARVAPHYPNTIFVTTSGNTAGPNLAALQFDFANPSYLAGMIAAGVSHSHIIGVIGGTQLPPVQQSFDAFAAGAKRIDPRVKVISSYIGNWDDVSAAREQALAQLTQGVDVIFQNADAAGLGIFQAVRQSKGALIFGTNSNQNAVAPTVTLGSVVIDLPHAFLTLAREVKAKQFHPHVVWLGMNDQVVTLVLNPALQSRIPPAIAAQVDSVQAQMRRGSFSATDTNARPHP